MLREALIVALATASLSCAPELDRPQLVAGGEIDCGKDVDVWEGVDRDGRASMCTVYALRSVENICQ